MPFAPADLRPRTEALGMSMRVSGLDRERPIRCVESRVPQHTELAWIFNSVAPLGELERQTQFNEKAARQESVNSGILMYPVLQAADILLYKADTVPVGEDQL